MFNNRGSNYNDINESKTFLRSTPKKSEIFPDRKNVEKRTEIDINNYSLEKLNDKLDSVIMSSEKSNQKFDITIMEFQNKMTDLRSENANLKSELLNLEGRMTLLKAKGDKVDSFELKLRDQELENKKLSNEVIVLKTSIKTSNECQGKNFEAFMNKAVIQLQDSFEAQIKQLTKTIESSYNKKTKNLKDILSKMSISDVSADNRNMSANEDSSIDEDTEEESEEESSDSTNNEVKTNTTNSEVPILKPEITKPSEQPILVPQISSTKTAPIRLTAVAATTSTSSLFSAVNSTEQTKPSFAIPKSDFKTFSESGSIFGSVQSTSTAFPTKPLVGNNTTNVSNLFGSVKSDTTSTTKPEPKTAPAPTMEKSSLFGNSVKSSLFSTPVSIGTSQPEKSSTASLFSGFGNAAKTTEADMSVPMFGSAASMPSFTSLASTAGNTGFGAVSGEASWQGGSKLFATKKADESATAANDDHEDAGDVEEHDPEFKPIIDLPPLIQIVRDDDQKEVLFRQRCKLYRFMNNEWKERGVGEMKILRATEGDNIGAVTMVMRREQVHKLCCNQRIAKDSHKFAPMGSDKSVCWVGADFSEGASEVLKLAVKFADKAGLDDFCEAVALAQASL